MTAGVLGEDQAPAYAVFRPDQGPAVYRSRFAAGHRFFAVRHEGRIVAGSWTAARRIPVPYLRRDIVLEPGALYDYDAYALPGYRGRGVFQAAGACAFAHYRAEGYRRMVALVAEENDAGLRTLVGMGFRVVGRLSAVLLGPWQRDRREQWGEDPVPTPVRGSSGA